MGSHSFDYTVTHNDAEERWEATTPYRHVVWIGSTEQEAIGAMLRGLCYLTKSGAFDPDLPYAPGKSLSVEKFSTA